MPAPAVTSVEFARLWREHGASPAKLSEVLGVRERAVYARRRAMEARGWELPSSSNGNMADMQAYQLRYELQVEDAVAVIFSDRHWWPGDGITPAEAALLVVLQRLDPDVVVANGDILDGARQCKHPPLGWELKPQIADELATLQVGMRRIAEHAKRAKKFRTVGNHDRRFDYHLAKTGADYRGIVGTRLSDHLPDWAESWSLHINPEQPGHTVIKHKLRNGATAGRTNALAAGTNIVTGHTHALDSVPIQSYSGTRYGVQCGTLANPRSAAFEYGEDHPSPGRAGFVVLTWAAGLLQPPELAECDDAGVCWFRGEPVAVKPRVRVKTREAA